MIEHRHTWCGGMVKEIKYVNGVACLMAGVRCLSCGAWK